MTTITLAVHPWFGDSVTVLRMHGRDTVWVERGLGEVRIIPIAWTALVPRVNLSAGNGTRGRLTPRAALDLSRWVAARRESS